MFHPYQIQQPYLSFIYIFILKIKYIHILNYMKLSKSDYKKILNYYKLSIPKNKSTLKEKAEDILASKLCKCINKVSRKNGGNKAKSVGLCRRSVLKKKSLKAFRFKCKNKPKLLTKKNRGKLEKIN
tara:strand:- start:2559 stop:2939 length:381 start_codon:yes stop_codon:yes gene_type:complete